jgi:hypothetical protein
MCIIKEKWMVIGVAPSEGKAKLPFYPSVKFVIKPEEKEESPFFCQQRGTRPFLTLKVL